MVMLVNKVVINVPRFHIKCLLLFYPILNTWNFTIGLTKQTSIRFHDNPTSGFWVVPCGRTDRRTEFTKLMVAFGKFASKPNKGSNSQLLILLLLNIMKTQRILLHGQNNFVNLVGESIGQLVYWWGLQLSLVWVCFHLVLVSRGRFHSSQYLCSSRRYSYVAFLR